MLKGKKGAKFSTNLDGSMSVVYWKSTYAVEFILRLENIFLMVALVICLETKIYVIEANETSFDFPKRASYFFENYFSLAYIMSFEI